MPRPAFQPGDPDVSPDVATTIAAQAGLMAPPAPPHAPPPPPSTVTKKASAGADQSPDEIRRRNAREQAREEERYRRQKVELLRGRAEDARTHRKGVGPISARPQAPDLPEFEVYDGSRVLDSKGAEIVLPGFSLKWVPIQDNIGRADENSQSVTRHRLEGFEPLLDPHTGQEIRGNLGIAMKIPTTGGRGSAAYRTQAHQRTAIDPTAFHDQFRAGIADANRRYDREVLREDREGNRYEREERQIAVRTEDDETE